MTHQPARPASLDGLLGYVAANLTTASPVHAALAEQLLDENTAPTEEAAYGGAAVFLAEHARELATMADPAAPEVSFFGDHGPAVAAWLRMRAAALDGQHPTP